MSEPTHAPTRAVIFDFDGTLVDSEPCHEEAIRRVVAPDGITFTHEEFVRDHVGTSDRACFGKLYADAGIDLPADMLEAMIANKAASFLELVREGAVVPFEGAIELLRACAERVPVGVCSGSISQVVEPVLKHLELMDLVGAVVTADRVTKTKPAPEGYIKTAELLGAPPEACVALEDSPTGVRAAVDAGMRTIGVLHVFDAAALSRASEVVGHIRELTVERLLG